MLILITFFIVLIEIFDFGSIQNIFKTDQILFNLTKNDSSIKNLFNSKTDGSRPIIFKRGKVNFKNRNTPRMNKNFDPDKIDQIPPDIIIVSNRSNSLKDYEDNFCFVKKRSNKKSRMFHSNWPVTCETKTSFDQFLKPFHLYDITLMLFFDNAFAKKSRDPFRDLQYMIKGLQEVYSTFDMINEIGRIKFYVYKVVKLEPFLDDLIDIGDFTEVFNYYIPSRKYSIPSQVIPIWFTGSNLFARDSDQISFKRIEGVASTSSFCRPNSASVLLNCNSINKAIITLAHEIAHVIGSEHDEVYLKEPEYMDTERGFGCEHDSNAFLMATIYSTKRLLLSAVSRAQIVKKFEQSYFDCFEKPEKLEHGFEDLKNLKAFSLDEQCQMSYSNRFKSDQVSFDDPTFCEKLRCKLGFIKLSNFPVMNGTPCDKKSKMKCCFGKCLINCTSFDTDQ